MNKKPRAKGYWYFTTHYECPVCGAGYSQRIRRYTKRPEKVWERHEFIISYDNCDV